MQKVILVMWVPVLVVSAGCNILPDERVAVLEQVINQQQAASVRMQESLNRFSEQLAKANISEKNKERLAEAAEDARRFIAETNVQVAAWQDEIERIKASGDTGVGAEMQIVGAGLTQAVPLLPPGIANIVGIAGLILGSIGAGVAKKKSNLANTYKGALVNVIKSVEAIPDVNKRPMNDVQNIDTKLLVKKIKLTGGV